MIHSVVWKHAYLLTGIQVGFLTQWQLFAQKIEGANWNEDAIDQATFDKMSGE